MIIGVISDVHLGKKLFRKLDGPINAYEKEVYNQFLRCIDDFVENKPDLVLIAGDLFEKENPSTISIDIANIGFRKLEKSNIKFIVVGGNHDFSNINYINKVHPFKHFNYKNGTFIYNDCDFYETDDTIISILPHQPNIVTKDMDAKERIRKQWAKIMSYNRRVPDKTKILLTHGIINSWMCFLRKDDKEHLESLESSNMMIDDEMTDQFDFTIIGHIHNSALHKLKRTKGFVYQVIPGSIVNEKSNNLTENDYYNTGTLYIDTSNKTFKRHKIKSISTIQISIDSIEKLEEFVNTLERNIYLINYHGDLQDISNDLYRKANEKSLFFNIKIIKKENNKPKVQKDIGFWEWVEANHIDYLEEFKNIIGKQ